MKTKSNLYDERIEISKTFMRAKFSNISLTETTIRDVERDLIAKTSNLIDLIVDAIVAIKLHAKLSIILLIETTIRDVE